MARRSRQTAGDRIFDLTNYLLLVVITILCIYPIVYIIFASVSDPVRLMANRGFLWKPLGFTLEGYKLVLSDNGILLGYANTIFYVVVGVTVNMIFTCMGAFVLSRRNLYWKKAIMVMITITMFFGGGLIPWFLVVKGLGMYNHWTALVFPFAINTWNMIIMRTGFEAVPYELEEAAKIDGAGDMYIFLRIILPLSKAVLAVILLYYTVGAWNSWFPSMIFLRDRSKFPLQLLMRELLFMNDTSAISQGGGTAMSGLTSGSFESTNAYRELVKYTTIVIATFPIMVLYPFLQKYFVQGVYVGSLKG